MTAFEGRHPSQRAEQTLEFASNYSKPGLVILFLEFLCAVNAEANMHARLPGF